MNFFALYNRLKEEFAFRTDATHKPYPGIYSTLRGARIARALFKDKALSVVRVRIEIEEFI